MELGMGNGLQQVRHCDANTRSLDKRPLLLDHSTPFAIESNDESRRDVDPTRSDLTQLVQCVAWDVLPLQRSLEQNGIRGFDADEDLAKIRARHRFQQLFVVGEINRRLGMEDRKSVV